MLPGIRTRRALIRSALLIVTWLGASGCRQIPATLPEPERHEVDPAGQAPAIPPNARAVPEPVVIPDLAMPPAPKVEEPPAPAPTPLLDAALARADARREALISELRKDDPGPPFVTPPDPIPTAPDPGTLRPVNLPPEFEPAPAVSPEPIAPDPTTAPPLTAIPVEPDPITPPLEPEPEIEPESEPAEAPPMAEPETPAAPAIVEVPEVSVEVPEVSAIPPPAPVGPVLEIADLRVCRKVLGFGHFEPLEATEFRAGQPIIVYCELAGLDYRQEGETFRSRLASAFELVEEGRDEPVWRQAFDPRDDVCQRQRRDYFVSYKLILPRPLAPGRYQLRLVQTDALAGRSTEGTLSLAIRP